MILEIGEVRDRVALDRPGGVRHGRRADGRVEVPAKRQAAHGWVLIEIAEGVDRRDREAGSSRRFGGRAGRDTDDQDFQRSTLRRVAVRTNATTKTRSSRRYTKKTTRDLPWIHEEQELLIS